MPMLRFTIRDLPWLTVVVGLSIAWAATSHRSALIEARMQAAERQAANCKVKFEELIRQNMDSLGTAEALLVTFQKAELSEDQRDEIRGLFMEELKSRGVEIKVGHW